MNPGIRSPSNPGDVGTGDRRKVKGHPRVMGCGRWGGGTTGRDLGD